jgi:hypothetical protein
MDESRDRVRRMSDDEIIKLFEQYDFRDQSGQRLTTCVDFKELLKMAMESRAAQDEARAIDEDPSGLAE